MAGSLGNRQQVVAVAASFDVDQMVLGVLKARFEFRCKRCGFTSTVVPDSNIMKDTNGNVVRFRRSCLNCGHVEPLSKEEMDALIRSLK